MNRLLKSPLEPHRFRGYKAELVAAFTSGALRVLEVGCGLRHYEAYCMGKQYVCVDIGLRPDVLASASSLPFVDGCFDRVIMFDVLEHVVDIKNAIWECRRVLADNGLLLILTPNTLGLGFYDSFADPSHLHHFSWRGLTKLLHSCGLNVIAQIPLPLHIYWPLRLIRNRKLRFIQQSICVVAVRDDEP
ncbi:MAG: class I SAM-dependent methyltransferase [Nitrososphaerota archaeon]